jgi:hypothetical protein
MGLSLPEVRREDSVKSSELPVGSALSQYH